MRVSTVVAYGVIASVFEGAPGDGLPWHLHPTPHGHRVIRGRTRLEIKGEPTVEMTPADANRELPPDIEHQIMVLEPDTIFVNMAAGSIDQHPLPEPRPAGEAGEAGVLLVDGTVVK